MYVTVAYNSFMNWEKKIKFSFFFKKKGKNGSRGICFNILLQSSAITEIKIYFTVSPIKK